jgi:hypothetical protein
MASPGLRSRDGWEWTDQHGLRQGMPSVGVISPESSLPTTNVVLDVIVAGAGYTGLTAARDATLAGTDSCSGLLASKLTNWSGSEGSRC